MRSLEPCSGSSRLVGIGESPAPIRETGARALHLHLHHASRYRPFTHARQTGTCLSALLDHVWSPRERVMAPSKPREASIERSQEYEEFLDKLAEYHEKRGSVFPPCSRMCAPTVCAKVDWLAEQSSNGSPRSEVDTSTCYACTNALLRRVATTRFRTKRAISLPGDELPVNSSLEART